MSSHTHDTIRRALLLSHRQCFLIVCILIRWYGGGCCCCSLLPLQLQCLSCLLCVYTKSHCECSARTRKRRRVKETARIDDDDDGGNNNNRQHTLASGENRHLCVSRAIDRKRETENTHRRIGTVRHLSSRRCTNWPKISHSHRVANHFYPLHFDVCCQSWQWTWRILLVGFTFPSWCRISRTANNGPRYDRLTTSRSNRIWCETGKWICLHSMIDHCANR